MIRLAQRSASTIAVSASLLIILAVEPVGAQTFTGFGQSFQYDQGFNPSVAIYNGIVVEVHNGTGGAGPLWYKVGRVAGPPVAEQNKLDVRPVGGLPTPPPITWSDSKQFDDNGFNPSVALVGSTVIEVHNGGATSGPLWYRTGTLNGDTINWSEKKQYDTGFNPQVAVTGNTVVEVHNGGAGVGPLWYRMGKLSGVSLTWYDSHKFDSFSTNPSIAAIGGCGSPSGVCVVEVHNDNAAPGPLWYRYGGSTDGSTITWENPVDYGAGWNPKISWLGGSVLLEVHNGQAGSGPMYYYGGVLSGQPTQYDNGNNPSVALDPVTQGTLPPPPPGQGKTIWNYAIEVHNGGAGFGPEWYHFGRVTQTEIFQ
ncbi:MAG TPA: hypothetical protein VLZ74_16830 [Methylocella sp.]|nr:hypothetical protein [Methylocella sp.]